MELREGRIVRPDGRVVAWTECGEPGGRVLLRLPGTPGCRWSVGPDMGAWEARSLRVFTSERPGFGASTWSPGRGFADHADDLVALLDDRGVPAAYVIGTSGAAPFVLALCQRHPHRVTAATITVGSAPMTDDEAAGMLEVNRRGRDLALNGDRAALAELLTAAREAILRDPVGAFEHMLADAPPDERERLTDPEVRRRLIRAAREALAAGVDGWVDESIAQLGDWAEISPEQISRHRSRGTTRGATGTAPSRRPHDW